MPGPQPRRAFQQRLGSAARRGAYAPPGVPGVYRVPRRTTSVITADAGLAAAAPAEWIQDEPLTVTRRITYVRSRQVVASTWVAVADMPAQAAALIATPASGTAGTIGGTVWTSQSSGSDVRADATQSTCLFDSETELMGMYYSPDLPPGATGYEDHPDDPGMAIAEPLLAVGTLAPGAASHVAQVVDCSLLRLASGTEPNEWHTPSALSTATVLETVPAGGGDLALSFTFTLDPDGQALFMPVGSYFLDGTGWEHTVGGGVGLIYDNGGVEDSGLEITFSYQRARYRFIY